MERAGRAAQFRFCWSWCGRESKTRPMPKALPGPQHVDEQPSIRVAPVFHLVSFFWVGPGRLRHWVRVLGWWQELPGPRSLQLPLFRIMSHEYIFVICKIAPSIPSRRMRLSICRCRSFGCLHRRTRCPFCAAWWWKARIS